MESPGGGAGHRSTCPAATHLADQCPPLPGSGPVHTRRRGGPAALSNSGGGGSAGFLQRHRYPAVVSPQARPVGRTRAGRTPEEPLESGRLGTLSRTRTGPIPGRFAGHMILYRHGDQRFPFLWETPDQPPARWHSEGEGPVHYFADTPPGAWAEFLRHEGITGASELENVRRALWAVQAPDDLEAAEPKLGSKTLTPCSIMSKLALLRRARHRRPTPMPLSMFMRDRTLALQATMFRASRWPGHILPATAPGPKSSGTRRWPPLRGSGRCDEPCAQPSPAAPGRRPSRRWGPW